MVDRSEHMLELFGTLWVVCVIPVGVKVMTTGCKVQMQSKLAVEYNSHWWLLYLTAKAGDTL